MSTPRNHMKITWTRESDTMAQIPVTETDLRTKTIFIGRVGLLFLSAGTGAWRVRQSMNQIARELGLTVSANIGLLSLDYSCFDGEESATYSFALTSSGVNTRRLQRLESFIRCFPTEGRTKTIRDLHRELDAIEEEKGLYSPLVHGLASGLACFAFTFLLGGGLLEMIGVLLGAGIGNFLRNLLIKRKSTLFLTIVPSVAAAGLVYYLYMIALERFAGISDVHECAFFCSMLFIIPGFPFITSGSDLSKQDMRSGLERLAYALLIILVATLTGGLFAAMLSINLTDFPPLALSAGMQLVLRLLTSFLGAYGFSMMFNSTQKMSLTAGLIGAITNTLRLELITFGIAVPGLAALLGSLTAGLLASAVHRKLEIPRLTLTVPSIVIMVPGLYFYRAIYSLEIQQFQDFLNWTGRATMIFIALPLGLVFARILTDREFRKIS